MKYSEILQHHAVTSYWHMCFLSCKIFKLGFWLADSTAASQSEAILENPSQPFCILIWILLLIQAPDNLFIALLSLFPPSCVKISIQLPWWPIAVTGFIVYLANTTRIAKYFKTCHGDNGFGISDIICDLIRLQAQYSFGFVHNKSFGNSWCKQNLFFTDHVSLWHLFLFWF